MTNCYIRRSRIQKISYEGITNCNQTKDILFFFLFFSEILFVAEWWSSSTCAIITDDETWAKMGKEHAIVVMNHSFEGIGYF